MHTVVEKKNDVMRYLMLFICLLAFTLFGGHSLSLAQECPKVSKRTTEQAADFFTTERWRNKQKKKNLSNIKPSDISPIKDKKICKFIKKTSPEPEGIHTEAFFQLPDGRFVVYTYVEGKGIEKTEEGTYKIRTGFSSITVYSEDMEEIAGAFL